MKKNLIGLSFFTLFFLLFFSSIVFNGNVFVSDGQLSHFFKPISVWEGNWSSGYYQLADTLSFNLYPLRIVVNKLFNNWLGFDIFVVLAYVLGSYFTYGYLYRITNDIFSSIIGGIVFALSGFMIAHLGHTSMIHSACWMPLIIWALEELRYKTTKKWIFILVSAISMSLLSGHLQIFTYTICLSSIYALYMGIDSNVGYKKYYLIVIIVFLFSIAINFFQLYPTFELAQHGFRKELTFEEFNSYILPPFQALMLFFPHLFGNVFYPLEKTEYFGQGNLPELMGYVGIITLIISLFTVVCGYRSNKHIKFWGFIAILSFLLIFGNNIPILSNISFKIPIINKFRALARHFLEFSFSIAVLTAIGVSIINKRDYAEFKYKLKSSILIFMTLFFISLVFIFFFYEKLNLVAKAQNVLLPGFFNNSSIWVSLILVFTSIGAILVFSKNSNNPITTTAFLVVLIINMLYFSLFYEWRNKVDKNILNPSEELREIKNDVINSHQRIIALEGHASNILDPQKSSLYRIPSANFYGPLILKNYSEFLSTKNSGWTNPNVLSPKDLSLNLSAIRYLFINEDTVSNALKSIWRIGAQCGPSNPRDFAINLHHSMKADSIQLISYLGCSTVIKHGAAVANFTIHFSDGSEQNFPINAGIDTSEWAYECDDVLPVMNHGMAEIYSSWQNPRVGKKNCEGHNYISSFKIKNKFIKRIEFKWNEEHEAGVLIVENIMFKDSNNKEYSVSLVDSIGEKNFKYFAKNDGTLIFKNPAPFQRAWLVGKTIKMPDNEILKAIKTSKSPYLNNEKGVYNFDPLKIALINDNVETSIKNFDENNAVFITNIENGRFEMNINSKSGGFLVVSENYYPGWKAEIDGVRTEVYRTNYSLLGIFVPQGGHIVRLNFFPDSLLISIMISIASFFLFVILITFSKKINIDNKTRFG